MKSGLFPKIKSLHVWAVVSSILTGTVLLTLGFTRVVQESWEFHNRFIVLGSLLFVCSSSVAAVCCGISWGLNKQRILPRTKTLITRIMFYGLFLLAPMFLSWGHVFHVKAKQRNREMPIHLSVEGSAYNPYVAYYSVCDYLGTVSVGSWIIWLWYVLVAKSAQHVTTFCLRHTELARAVNKNSSNNSSRRWVRNTECEKTNVRE